MLAHTEAFLKQKDLNGSAYFKYCGAGRYTPNTGGCILSKCGGRYGYLSCGGGKYTCGGIIGIVALCRPYGAVKRYGDIVEYRVKGIAENDFCGGVGGCGTAITDGEGISYLPVFGNGTRA